MKQRLLTGWSLTRIVYLAIGSLIMVQSFIDRQWLALLGGAYFASMGLFAFGCAAGNCFGGNCVVEKNTVQADHSEATVLIKENKTHHGKLG
ncbi:MAG: hypothetical protein RLZZ28_2232 [Bacteroidota bacterium]|jgi:hypothetical protein